MTNPQFGFAELAAAQEQPEVLVNGGIRLTTQALAGEIEIEFDADEDYELGADEWQFGVIRMVDEDSTPLISAPRSVIYPDVDAVVGGPSRARFVFVNETLQTLTIKRSGGTGVEVAAGSSALVFHDGEDIVEVGGGGGGGGGDISDLSFVTVGNEVSSAPNSRRLVAGTNVTLDTTTPGQIAVSASIPGSAGDPIVGVAQRHAGAIWKGSWEAFGPTVLTETAGTPSTPSISPSSSTLVGGIPRRQSVTSTGTTNGTSFRDSSGLWFYRSVSGNSKIAGFKLWARFYLSSPKAGARYFVGLYPSTSGANLGAAGVDAQTNLIGVGKEDSDTNMQVIHNDGAGNVSKVDLGVTPVSLSDILLDLFLTCPAGGGDVDYEVVNVQTGSVIGSGTLSSNLPAVDQGLTFHAVANNGSLTTTACGIGLIGFATRHDY